MYKINFNVILKVLFINTCRFNICTFTIAGEIRDGRIFVYILNYSKIIGLYLGSCCATLFFLIMIASLSILELDIHEIIIKFTFS